MPKSYNQSFRDEVIRVASVFGADATADKYKINKHTVYRWLRDYHKKINRKLPMTKCYGQLLRADFKWHCPGCQHENRHAVTDPFDVSRCENCHRGYAWNEILGRTEYYKFTSLLRGGRIKT